MIGIENPEFVYFESNVVAVSFTWDERPVDKLSQIQSLKNLHHKKPNKNYSASLPLA